LALRTSLAAVGCSARSSVVLALWLASACRVSIDYSGTAYQCDQFGRCPPGFECRDGVCVPLGEPAFDAGSDAATPPADANDLDGGNSDATPPDAAVAAACGTTDRLVDDFEDGIRDPQWFPAWADPGTSVSEENGQLVVRVNANAGDNWAGYHSEFVHNMAGRAVEVRVPQVGPLYTILEVRHHNDAKVQLLESEGAMRAGVQGLPSGNGERAQVPYDSVAHAWWRIREQDGVLYWELSADRTAWTTLYQEADPFPFDMVYVILSAGGDMATATEAHFDDLNPDGDKSEPWCPIASLRDDFEDGVLATPWADSWTETGCELAETGGEATILFDGTPDAWCGYETAPVYDACDGRIELEIASPLDVPDTDMSLVLSFPSEDVELSIECWDGMLRMFERVGANTPMTTAITYNPGPHRWWRIRESAGTLSWETSPNGSSWTAHATRPTDFDCGTAYVIFAAGVWDTWTGGATEAAIDNVNPAQ